MIQFNVARLGLTAAFFAFAPFALGGESIAQNNANPCAASPRAVNPCAAAAEEAGIDVKLFTRPKGTMLAKGTPAVLIKEGEKLFKDENLSTNGSSCASCHAGFGLFNASFAKPFPHKVSMAKDNGKDQIALDEMIQLCLLAPMEAKKALPWDSRKLAALTAYVAEIQKSFVARGRAVNPCAATPRAGANPCAR